jgi:hypothetical protein
MVFQCSNPEARRAYRLMAIIYDDHSMQTGNGAYGRQRAFLKWPISQSWWTNQQFVALRGFTALSRSSKATAQLACGPRQRTPEGSCHHGDF